MYRRRRCFVVVGLALGVALALFTTVGQGEPLLGTALAAGKPTVFHISFREQTVEAEFSQEVNHVFTSVYVLADSIGLHISPGPPARGVPGVYLLIQQQDTQTGVDLVFASGEAAPVDLRVGAQLTWATLKATVPVMDMVSGRTLVATISIQWQANGPLERIVQTDHHHSPGLTVTDHFQGLRRASSTVTGTLTGWAGLSLPPATWTNLEMARYGAVEISHTA